MKTLVARLASRLGWFILGFILIGPISGCLESDEPQIVPGAEVVRIPDLEGIWAVHQSNDQGSPSYTRFARDHNNRYTNTDIKLAPDSSKQAKTPIEIRFIPLPLSEQNRQYFLGITETVSEGGARSKLFYSELQWTGEHWTWGIYHLASDTALQAAAETVVTRKGLSISKSSLGSKLNGPVNSQTLQALFSDTTFRKSLMVQNMYTLRPLSLDDKQKLSAAGYDLATSTGAVPGIQREKAAEPLAASSTQELLKQLETKIGTGGPFDRELFERTSAALMSADSQSPTLQELVANTRDFVAGKIRASLFVSYLRETIPALSRAQSPARGGAAWLAEKAGTGDLWATFFLARAHYYAARKQRDTQRFEQFESAAFPETSRPYWQASQQALQDNNFNGSFAEALKLAEQGVTQGFSPLINMAAILNLNGEGTEKNEAEGMRLLRLAAADKFPMAMTTLGSAYRDGQGMPKDLAQALHWYRQAADRGHAGAMFNLGVAYGNGQGVAKDEAEAVHWFRKAATLQNPRAMSNLGAAYAKGRGVAENVAEAVEWYRKAADLGDPEALYNLGLAYATGQGVAKDEAEAVRWYEKAADHQVPESMFYLGGAYASGRGVAKDEAKAVRWYQKAADLGQVDAMTSLGFHYMYGRGVVKDETEAMRWYRRAAELGHPPAMSSLGLGYANGTGVPRDHAESARWYRQAADRGHAGAMVLLGVAYSQGDGVPKDRAQAVHWYRQAADRGDADAMHLLGIAYAEGDGVAKDTSIALEWLDKAAKLGDDKAQNLAAKLRRSMVIPGARPLNAKEWANEFRNARYITRPELVKAIPAVRLEIISDTTVDRHMNQDTIRSIAQSILQGRGIQVDKGSTFTLRLKASVPVNKKLVRESTVTGGGWLLPQTHTDEFPLIEMDVDLDLETMATIYRNGKFYYRPVVIADGGARMYNTSGAEVDDVVNSRRLKEAIELAFSQLEELEDRAKLSERSDVQRWHSHLWNPVEDESMFRDYKLSLSSPHDDLDRMLSGVAEAASKILFEGSADDLANEGAIRRLTAAELSRARINESATAQVNLVQRFEVEKRRVTTGLFRWQEFGLLRIRQTARQDVAYRLGNEVVRNTVSLFSRHTIEAAKWDDAQSFVPQRIDSAVQEFVKEVRFRK